MKSKLNSAIFYGRVSTDKQSTEAQQAGAREYCTLKKLVFAPNGELCEEDVSGSVAIWERPKGALLRRLVDAGNIGHVVVAKLDRLGRSASDLLATVEYFDRAGVVLHILDIGGDSLSSQGPAGRLMFTILAGMAEFERELIRGRINDKLALKRNKGELCGTVPYGWDAVETGEVTPKKIKIRQLVDNDEEQKWIKMMAHLRASGWSYYAIARYLNENGVQPKHSRGDVMNLRRADGQDGEKRFVSGQWQSGNVAKVLNNKTVRAWLSGDDQQAAA